MGVSKWEAQFSLEADKALGQDWVYWLFDETYNGNLQPLDVQRAVRQKMMEVAHKTSVAMKSTHLIKHPSKTNDGGK